MRARWPLDKIGAVRVQNERCTGQRCIVLQRNENDANIKKGYQMRNKEVKALTSATPGIMTAGFVLRTMRFVCILSGNAHLFVGDSIASTRIGSGRLSDIVMLVVEGVSPTFFIVREIDIDGCRSWSSFWVHSLLLCNQFFRFVHLVQMLFKKSNILGVALERGIRQVTDEWDEANKEIEEHIEQHQNQDFSWQSAFDLLHPLDQQSGHCHVESIANSRNQSDHGGPTEAETHEVEQTEVEFVGGFAGSSKNVGIVGGNVCWDLLLDLLRLVLLSGMRDDFIEGIIL